MSQVDGPRVKPVAASSMKILQDRGHSRNGAALPARGSVDEASWGSQAHTGQVWVRTVSMGGGFPAKPGRLIGRRAITWRGASPRDTGSRGGCEFPSSERLQQQGDRMISCGDVFVRYLVALLFAAEADFFAVGGVGGKLEMTVLGGDHRLAGITGGIAVSRTYERMARSVVGGRIQTVGGPGAQSLKTSSGLSVRRSRSAQVSS